jgi:two-component system, NarL family, invasion response regulator UvrY
MVKILAVDDHALIRKGLKRFFEELTDFKTNVVAVPGCEGFNQLKRKRPDMVILEPHLRGVNGLSFLRQLAKRRPRIPVLIYTDSPPTEMAVRLLKSGADGYLTKDCPWEELVVAVRKILGGHKFISDSVAETLVSHIESVSRAALAEKLSRREREIGGLIVAGISLKEIAAKLSLSQSTVSTYRRRILDKLGIESNAQLVRFAAEIPEAFGRPSSA